MLLTKYLRCAIFLCGLCANGNAMDPVLNLRYSFVPGLGFLCPYEMRFTSQDQPPPLIIKLQQVTTTNERFEQLITQQQTKIISDINLIRVALAQTIERDLSQHFDQLINAARDTLNKDDFAVSNAIFEVLSDTCRHKRFWALDPLLELTANKEYVFNSFLVENAMLCYEQGRTEYLNKLLGSSTLFKFKYKTDYSNFLQNILQYAKKYKKFSAAVLLYQYHGEKALDNTGFQPFMTALYPDADPSSYKDLFIKKAGWYLYKKQKDRDAARLLGFSLAKFQVGVNRRFSSPYGLTMDVGNTTKIITPPFSEYNTQPQRAFDHRYPTD